MKVYFSASIEGKKIYRANYEAIIEALESLGHEVLLAGLMKVESEDVLNIPDEEKVRVHHRLDLLKMESDLVLMELSYRSFGLGQEIAHALRVGKPVLGLYLPRKMPHLLLADAGDRLLFTEYTLDNLKETIMEGIEYLNPNSEKRFTMILPSPLVDHLDKISRDTKISRSEYIRKLLEKEVRKKH